MLALRGKAMAEPKAIRLKTTTIPITCRNIRPGLGPVNLHGKEKHRFTAETLQAFVSQFPVMSIKQSQE